MKKILKISAVAALMLSATPLLRHQSVEAAEKAKKYLVANNNYYTESTVRKGFLDKVMSDGTDGNEQTVDSVYWTSFKRAVDAGLVNYTEGMTFNEYFAANNMSPEDNFSTGNSSAMKVNTPKNGGFLNAHLRSEATNPITYLGPATNKGLAYWGENTYTKPVLFSRLSVGLEKGNVEGELTELSRDSYLAPNQIGYGENGTVNDYMLTEENNFVIPARFNRSRNDVFLTMRAHQFFGASYAKPRAFLEVRDEAGALLTNTEKTYVNTTSSIFVSESGYDQLGTMSKIVVANQFASKSKELLTNIPVNEFAAKTNSALMLFEGTRIVPMGMTGQIKLDGFHRTSDIDNNFLSSDDLRETDAEFNLKAHYYMYTDLESDAVQTPVSSNGKHLFSPNETKYTIEVVRPYFTQFGELANTIEYSEDIFEEKLGENSFTLTDNGINKATGEPIGVDVTRVKVRVSEDGVNYSDVAYSISELKELLNNPTSKGKTFTLAYTYAAVDADDAIVGKLPSEIADNTGAYAVPFVRKVMVADDSEPVNPPVNPVNPVEPTTPNNPTEVNPTTPTKKDVDTSDVTLVYALMLLVSGIVLVKVRKESK